MTARAGHPCTRITNPELRGSNAFAKASALLGSIEKASEVRPDKRQAIAEDALGMFVHASVTGADESLCEYGIAQCYNVLGQDDASAEHFAAAVAIDTAHPSSRMFLNGLAQSRSTSDPRQAIEALRKMVWI